ncbi:Nodulin-like [Trema orientale]|uniref:Nodulin-like n=1 Tax=Trema orientale TaxID=63057 RepID=A0A2P5A9Q6_TREOI|nr:Nodulin-like [Trema orientale]
MMATAGACYIFGLYQMTLNLISFFKDVGANVGIISGLINEVMLPWVVVLAIGAAMNFTSLAVFLLVMIIIENNMSFDQEEYGGIAAAVIFLLFLHLGVVFGEEYRRWKENKSSSLSSNLTQNSAPYVSEPTNFSEKIICNWNQNVFKLPQRGEDYTILQALLCPEMMTLFLATMCD